MGERAVILIVEDSAPTRAFLADNLTADGYEVLLAAELSAALRTLELHPVDSGRRHRPAGRVGPGAAADQARVPQSVLMQ